MPDLKKRVTLDLSSAEYNQLQKVKELMQADNQSAVMRDALRLYKFIIEEAADEGQITIKKTDGEHVDVMLLGCSLP